MAGEEIDGLELYRRLRARVAEAGSQAKAAKAIGVSEGYLSDVLNARRDVGEKILAWMGLVRQVRYAPARKGARRRGG